MWLLSPLFPKDACDAVMVGKMVRVGGDHSFPPGHICSQFARTFFRSKMMHTGHRTNWTLEDNTCVPVLLYSCTDALFFESVSSNFSSDLFLQIHQQGGGLLPSFLRDLANCYCEVSSSNQLPATFLEMHLLQTSKVLDSWDWTASPSYWALITSWWKFEMSSSPINFYCFTGLAHLRKVSILTSLCPLGRVPKRWPFFKCVDGWRGGGRGGAKIHL